MKFVNEEIKTFNIYRENTSSPFFKEIMQKKFNYPKQEYLKECFDYDPNTGNLTWKHRPLSHFKTEAAFKRWNQMFPGKIAGYKNKSKQNDDLFYLTVTLDNKIRKAHVLCWIWYYGYEPERLDHIIEGNGTDNRICNLREISTSNNARKATTKKSNTSGVKGASLTKYGNYEVSLKVNKKSMYIGKYDDVNYAGKMYATAVLITSGENFTGVESFDANSSEYKFIYNKIHNPGIKLKASTNTTGYLGVYKKGNKFSTSLTYNKNKIFLKDSSDCELLAKYHTTASIIVTGEPSNDIEPFDSSSKEYKEIYKKVEKLLNKGI